MEDLKQILGSGVDKIYPSKEALEKLLDGGKKIKVYLGVDPTGSKLHLGHTIGLRKLNQFAQLGHQAILLIGTGTVLAGDPSQRATARKTITSNEINQNIKTWKEQAKKVLDLSKIKIVQNGDWLLKLDLKEIIKIASNISATQLFKRDMFQERIKRGDIVWTHEILYPLLQGYDSVFLDVDLEIGGSDQTFNMLIGRELQRKMNNHEKFVLTTPMINGIDGQPMSKTSGNCIWLDDTAQTMFNKVMLIGDSEISAYWKLLTNLPESDLNPLKPLEAKKGLAFEITRQYHNVKEAQDAQEQFEKINLGGQLPRSGSVPQVEIAKSFFKNSNISQLTLKAGLAKSMSDAKRLVLGGTITLDGQKITNPSAVPGKAPKFIRRGTAEYREIIVKDDN